MSRTPKRAREKTAADDIYNARKRYWRSAERNLKRAEQTSGASAAKFRRQAEQELKQALSTYDTSKKINVSAPIKRLAQSLNIDVSYELTSARQLSEKEKRQTINRSFNTLESRLQNPEIRRDRQARTILNNPAIGSRILGGLVDVWRDKALVWSDKQNKYVVDNEKIYGILTEYFGVETIADVLDKLEETMGERLYRVDGDNETIYETVKLLIQTKVADNTLVQ